MAFVKVKRPWTRLPPNPRIDSGNPDTQGLIFAGDLLAGKNLVNNRSASTTQPVNTSLFGQGMETVSGTGTEEIVFLDHSDLEITTDYTALWMGKRTGTEGANGGFFAKRQGATDFELYLSSNNLAWSQGDDFPISTLDCGADGDFLRVGVSNDASGLNYFVKINNDDFKTDTDPSLTCNTGNKSLGIGTIEVAGTSNHVFAVHHWILIWNRKIPEPAIRRIYESNGLSLLVSRTVSIHIPVASCTITSVSGDDAYNDGDTNIEIVGTGLV